MDDAVKCAAPACYQRRHPEKTLWYRTVQAYFETWLALSKAQFDESPPTHVVQAFRRYLECGILAFGFARARCKNCGHDFLVAFSCKGRGICPSCNTRRMVETAAHLVDHVFPPLPVRQWVLSVPKRLRYFLQRNAALQGAVLRIFLRAVEHCLRKHSPGCGANASLGAVAFIQRFGSSLNEHVHFHCCIIEGLFDSTTNTDGTVAFHPSSGLDDAAFRQVQAITRRRILRLFVRRGLIDKADGDEMAAQKHDGGFSLDASIRIEADDRPGLERLLRYCARPPFSLQNLHQLDEGHLVYHNPKPHPGTPSDLVMTPLLMIGKIAALIPPPKWHLHRYFGVLAPNSHLRAAVTAKAPEAVIAATSPQVLDSEDQPHRSLSHYLWSQLLARIYEVLPLICPICHAQMRIIAFITDASTIQKILGHIGEPTQPPTTSPARGPPLWEAAITTKEAHNEPHYDLAAQPAPEFEFDQRISW